MIDEFAARYGMFPAGAKVLCAVSGGADSMCLLHWLYTNAQRLEITVCAAHFEHGLRGEESLRDRDFVRGWCSERDIEFYTESGDVNSFATENSLSTEEAARILRYNFLQAALERSGSDIIATAHNLEDNAETVLLNLTRGTGIKGLAGIPPVRDRIVRPLLGTGRAEIEEYDRENNVPYITDSSNLSDDYSRNKIRHAVIPTLRDINSGFGANILRMGELLRAEDGYMDTLADGFISEYYDGDSLPLKEIKKLDPAVSARVIRKLCPKTLSRVHVDAIQKLCIGTELAFADVPGARIRRQKGRLYFTDPPVEKRLKKKNKNIKDIED